MSRSSSAIRATLPPLFELVTPMPYVALQQMLDEANAWGFYGYDKGAYLDDLTDDVIDVLTEHVAARRPRRCRSLLFYRLDGAYCEVAEDDTAFGGAATPRYFGQLHRPVPDAGAAAPPSGSGSGALCGRR